MASSTTTQDSASSEHTAASTTPPSSRQINTHSSAQPSKPQSLSTQSRTNNTESKKASSPNTNSQQPPPTSTRPASAAIDRPLNEVIGESFAPFDHQKVVVRPFTEETARDTSFEQELGQLLLDAIIETHAWAAARPKFESQLAVQKLEQKISDVIEVEKTQGTSFSTPLDSLSLWPALLFEQTRQSLHEFVTRMKTALAALTGL